MNIVNLIQGSPEWLEHRINFYNASEAPAMLGESKYTTRDQLLHQKATGITKEVDAGTQKKFDDGHKFEALARPVAEKIIGMELYPVTATNGVYSASFDGITMDETIIFEHKTLNAELRAVFTDTGMTELPLMYRVQMEQQLMVSGAEKCLFMASKWDGETLLEEVNFWYHPDLKLRQRIIDGWAQFEIDLANYVPPVRVEKVVAETVEALPVPSVVVRGEITTSNLHEITPLFDNYLGSIKTELGNDQDFADAEANAKNCRETAKRIKALRENIIAQMVDVNTVDSTLANYEEAFNKVGLRLEKAVKEQKETIKTNAVLKGRQDYFAHIQVLEAEIAPIRITVQQPDFAGAIKNVRTIESMQSRINDALAAGKIEADAMARDLRAKLAWYQVNAEGYQFLFNDLTTVIYKAMDDFQMVLTTRIAMHKQAEAQREAEIKARAEAEALAKVNEVKPQVSQSEPKAIEASTQDQVAQLASNLTLPKHLETTKFSEIFTPPSANQIVELVARHFGVDKATAHKWLLETDFAMLMAA